MSRCAAPSPRRALRAGSRRPNSFQTNESSAISSVRFQCLTDDPLRLGDEGREMALAAEALGVNLVQTLGSRRPRREPAARGDDLQAADRGTVARRAGQLAR